ASTTTTSLLSPPRVAVDDVVSAPVHGPVHIDVLANDSEPRGTLVPRSVSIVSPPLHGTAKPARMGGSTTRPTTSTSAPTRSPTRSATPAAGASRRPSLSRYPPNSRRCARRRRTV